MTQRSAKILEDALALPSEERAELAEQILSSLELAPHQEIDQLWAQEAEERLDALHRKEISTVSAKEVFKRYPPRKI